MKNANLFAYIRKKYYFCSCFCTRRVRHEPRKMFKPLYYILFSALLLVAIPFVCAQNNNSQSKTGSFTLVIDAGHGGHDAGAVGRIAKEKDLNLDVAKRLAKKIEDEYPEVKVLLTRKKDVFLTLQERADFVNKNNADLFICIHTNAAENRNVTGAETFVLGIDKMESNLDVAMRENAVIMLEDNYEATYEGFDPKSIDSYIMFELMQDQYFDRSLQFATLVQQEFCGTLNRSDRGVRQAGFWVLHKSACPSVLVEMGFISNREEERFLASEAGKEDLSNAIFDAFVSYKAAVDKRNGITPKVVNPKAKTERVSITETENKAKPAVSENNKPAETKTDKPVPVYRIQICTTTTELKKNDPTFKGLKNCKYTKDGKYYKYTYGEDTDYQTISDIQKELRAKFKDCFIVAFLGDKQISVKEARAMKP